jgi:hypothetical protein
MVPLLRRDSIIKYEPVSVPSVVKLEKEFRELSLKKGQDPEIWITELEDL